MKMEPIILGQRKVGLNHPCFIIAEGCDNHLGDMDTAKEMARQAKLAGADAIKFQHHLPEEEMLREGVPMSANFNIPLFDFLKKYALTLDQHAELMSFCKEIGIYYMCTPFSWKAAQEINELGVEVFKIGSGELTDIPSLQKIASLGKPMILSTGMATWDEITETVESLRPINKELMLLNCTSEYPADYSHIHIGLIKEIQNRYEIIVGHSDHTPDIYTCFGAVAQGAKLIEKHFILDKRQPGPDQAVSIDSKDLSELVSGIRKIEASFGSEKKVHDLEQPIRSWAHRSVVSIKDIPKGTPLTEEYIWTKRPGTGIPSKHLPELIGKVTKVDVPKDSLLKWEDVN